LSGIITGKLNHWALPLSTKNPVSVKPYPTIKPHLIQQQTKHFKFPAIFRTANGAKQPGWSMNLLIFWDSADQSADLFLLSFLCFSIYFNQILVCYSFKLYLSKD
jgi:hypothetical protein